MTAEVMEISEVAAPVPAGDILSGNITGDANSSMVNLTDDGQGTSGSHEQCWSLHPDERAAYGYATAIVCLIGLVVNAFTIVVLTRRNMVTPVNALLTALAVADSCLLAAQFPLSIMFYITSEISGSGRVPIAGAPASVSYWAVATAVTLFCRTVAVWEAVAVASFRYICVRHPAVARQLCTVHSALIVTALIIFVSSLTQLPGWLIYAVVPVDSVDYTSFPYCLPVESRAAREAAAGHLYTLGYNLERWSTAELGQLIAANSWLFAVAVKLAPPALLAVFTALLCATMCRAEARRKSLMRAGRSEASRRAREHNLATAALFAVVALHLLVELPQGVVLLVSQLEPRLVQEYERYGDFMNVATLIAMSVNFFIYTTMMRAFRNTVKGVVLCRLEAATAGGGGMSEAASTYGESKSFIAKSRNGTAKQQLQQQQSRSQRSKHCASSATECDVGSQQPPNGEEAKLETCTTHASQES